MLAALGPVLQEGVARHADGRRDLPVVQEGAVVDDARQRARVRKAPLVQHGGEAELAPLPGEPVRRLIVERSSDIRSIDLGGASPSVELGQRRQGRLQRAAMLAIGAGGSTSWERCCLGLPAVLSTLADNQRLSSRPAWRSSTVTL